METESNTITIASAAGHSYVLPLAVMLQSLKDHLRSGIRPVLYLLHCGLAEQDIATISSIVETHPVVPSGSQLQRVVRDARYPLEASFPMLLPEILGDSMDRVLFLDPDTLVLDDLMMLWDTPLDRFALGAVVDSAIPRCNSPRGVKNCCFWGIPPGAPYFNGGVMLMDLSACRRLDVAESALRYLTSTTGPVDFLHQEAWNAVLWDQWKPLDPRWNLLASWAGRGFERPASNAWRRPGVVHFAGRMKPWRGRIGGPFDRPYREAMETVRALCPARTPTLPDHLRSVYDRYLRTIFRPLEHQLWKHRLI